MLVSKVKYSHWIKSGAFAAISAAIMVCGCMMGGAEIGNPRTVTGKVVDAENHPLSGITVALLAFDRFNPVLLQTGDTVGRAFDEVYPVAQATTDQNGNYVISFRSVVSGCALFGRSTSDSVMLYRSAVNLEGNDDVQLCDTAYKAVVLTVGITDSLYGPDRFMYIKGTTLASPITTAGRVDILVPRSVIDLGIYSASGDSIVPTGIQFAAIDAKSNSGRVDVSGQTHVVSPPFLWSASRQISLTDATVGIQFRAYGAKSNLLDPVTYRFDWGDSTSSGWLNSSATLTDVVVYGQWSSRGTFTVRAQARSIRDTSVISGFSDTIVITVQ